MIGAVDGIELPAAGSMVEQGAAAVTLEAGGKQRGAALAGGRRGGGVEPGVGARRLGAVRGRLALQGPPDPLGPQRGAAAHRRRGAGVGRGAGPEADHAARAGDGARPGDARRRRAGARDGPRAGRRALGRDRPRVLPHAGVPGERHDRLHRHPDDHRSLRRRPGRTSRASSSSSRSLMLAPVLLALGAGKVFGAAKMWMQGYRSAGSLRFRGGLAYAPGHTWVKAEGNSLKVGLDDLAQRILPWTVAVELPSAGPDGEGRGAGGDALLRRAARCRWRRPRPGRIVAVNPEVMREPTLAKSENYGSGWLFAIEPEGKEWKTLPVGERARSWLRAEGERLDAVLRGRSWAWRRPTAASSSAPRTRSSPTPSGRPSRGASCGPDGGPVRGTTDAIMGGLCRER